MSIQPPQGLQAYKMHTNSNDFVIIESAYDTLPKRTITMIADRKQGIGCDQVITFFKVGPQRANCQFFNPDGSTAELCLNGLCALGQLLSTLNKETWTIQTQLHTFTTSMLSEKTVVTIPKNILQKQKQLSVLTLPKITKASTLDAQEIHVGNPHLLLRTSTIETHTLTQIAKEISSSSYYPNGINISLFTQSKGAIFMQTYERGVGLTQGCGSAGLAAFLLLKETTTSASLAIHQPGGTLYFTENRGHIKLQATSHLVATLTFTPTHLSETLQ